MIDVHAFIGPYPFRHLPHPEPAVLTRVLEREGLEGAWVGHLPSALPIFLAATFGGALLGTWLGVERLPREWLLRFLGTVLLVAGGKLLFA